MALNNPTLDLASALLSRNIPVTGRHSLVTALLSGSDPVGFAEYNPDRDLESLAMRLFDVVEGGTFATEFCSDIATFLSPSPAGSDNSSSEDPEIRAIAEKVREFVRVTLGNAELDSTVTSELPDSYRKCVLNNKVNYAGQSDYAYTLDRGCGGNVEGGIFNSTSTGGAVAPTKSSPSLVAIELMNPRLSMTTRDSSAVSIFTSLIPPVEMSRCVPYISIKTATSGTSTVENGNLSGLSLVSYLIGRGEPAPTLGSGIDGSLLLNPSSQPLPAAMDVFTAPQTLVPAAGSAALRERGNIPAVLDRFRPLMTLKGLSFNVVPTKGFMSYKSGKVELILHDRSRLGEVAGFVKPGLYAGTEMEIEYGWSHPDGVNSQRMNRSNPGSDLYNPVGAFLDSMRVKEKYNIVNSSFNFDDVGQVNISLTIAMKGARSLDIASIADCAAIPASSNLETLMAEISAKIAEMKGSDSEKFNSLYDSTLINSVGSTSSALSLDEKALSEIRAKINAIKGSSLSSEDTELAGMLDKLFTEGGAADEYKTGIDEAVRLEFENLATGVEIFPCSNSQVEGDPSSITLPGVTSDNVVSNPISLGRVLMSFVGKPLVRSGQYDEVQFIFHTFNERASFMRDLSIAKFPIEREALQQGVSDVLKKNLKMSSMQFIGFLTRKFIGDTTATVYGFRQLYEVDPETGEYKRKESGIEGDSDQEKAAKAEFEIRQQEIQQSVLKAAGISDGTFRIPKVSIYPECVPHKTQKDKTILRMHVVDETCTSFGSMYDLLKSARGGNITSFGFSNNPEHPLLTIAPELQRSTIESRRQAVINDMVEKGVVKQLIEETSTDSATSASQYQIDVGKLLEGKSISKVKKFISEGVPTIRFGSATGTIVSAGLSSQSDPALTNINIINMNKSTTGTPDLARSRGLPLQIAPTECTLEMLGCPLMQFGQNFFIDFGTGTTADNIYFVTGLDHKIEAGSFTTSVKLTFLDAYGSYQSTNLKVQTASDTLKTMLSNAGVQSVVDSTAAISSTTTNNETSTTAAGTPSDFITALNLSSQAIYTDLISTPVPRGVAVVVDKVNKKAVNAFSEKNYTIVSSSTDFASLKKKNYDSNTYSLVIVPLATGTVGYVSATVYNLTTLTPASRSERNGLVNWLGYEGSTYSDLTVGTNDWAGYVSSVNTTA